MNNETHEFGGPWTQRKLAALADYLRFYSVALKDQPFNRMYVDAFAGTGTLSAQTEDGPIGPDERQLLAGSASIALGLDRPFDRYVFIDANQQHVAALGELRGNHPDLLIDIYHADANEHLKHLVRATNWKAWRAVVFLDPYGAQIEWDTLVALAETEAVDVWVLVPFGIAYTRMIPHSGDVPEGWDARLTRSFGTDEWRDAAYEEVRTTIDMFSGDEIEVRRKKLEDIERWFLERLKEIYPAVSDPIYLENSSGTWLYSLYLAIANPSPRAQGLAMKVAKHIIDKLGDHRGTE